MDAISYSYADKQAKRIKKFINDPDSTSGVLTVPKVIASGESVTIPAGRVAVLPNVQVDGTLNVEGEVFIPSGATLSRVVEKVTSTDNAVVRFNGTTGDIQNSGVTIDDNNNLKVTSPAGSGCKVSIWSTETPTFGAWSFETLSGRNLSFNNDYSGTEVARLTNTGNLLIGTATDNGVDKLQVNGSIKCSNDSKIGGVNHSIVVYNGAMSYPATAIHFKFNYRPLTINKMICLRLSGYNYGSAESFNATVSCYVYTGTAHLHSLCTTDSRVNFYLSSDGYLTLKVALNSSVYYPSFVIDSILTPMGFVESSNLLVIQASSSNI